MVLSWLGRRWKLLTFVPILVYACAVLVSIILMSLHEYHLVGTVLVNTAGVSTIIGATVFVLFLIAGLFEPLDGLPRIRGWFSLVLVPLVVTFIIVFVLGAYTARGVFFMPIMTEAYLGSVIFCLGFALIGSMLVT
jgi:heme/copper-type cytochrome/quinol oxidase subunit 2